MVHISYLISSFLNLQILFILIFSDSIFRKIVDFSGTWTRIVGVEGEHADHDNHGPSWADLILDS